ncbi:hypothetical protein BY454_105128 [Marinobacter persicus]|uniref:Uncharacterized protein n=1 Tax=Marinobacter persicus TaxID=930118 RepID=A0A2S6G846_9GAMM|nr:hypothetical protein BY455_106128 [Marinobacter persicus]PPK55364.1 hypothetical protein B0H24_1006128 [Marinobacter persicus]PPK59131.1 hypothetical protein BY454_105128 [Marinobacter persicus]
MFQSTRPRGARHGRARATRIHGCFNPRAREGRDPLGSSISSVFSRFQSTRPRGARPAANTTPMQATRFQSTRPRGARPQLQCGGHGIGQFQSTRPRGARLGGALQRFFNGRVSIHAPARGATSTDSRAPRAVKGFNPRAREGRDGGIVRRAIGPRLFQSTRPRGARRLRCAGGRSAGIVSIHAPARGATYRSMLSPWWNHCFNPRAREGRDPRSTARQTLAFTFQSTRPRGARPAAVAPAGRC